MTDTALSSDQPQPVPIRDGEMARRSLSFKWAATEPQYLSIYNDAYAPLLGSNHPQALGLPRRECWRETWHGLHSLIAGPFHGGAPTWIEDQMREVNRAIPAT